jgi:molecular chaperone HtpG
MAKKKDDAETTTSGESFAFQAEVGKLLEIVAHSLYSHKEIFLRELISNSSDACDRLRYAQLTDTNLISGDPFKITLAIDKKAKTLAISDNGIGMDREELSENLGTIARSGTQAFVDQLTGDSGDDVSLIGQFGVGFYASFMVSDTVEVLSRKAGGDEAWLWSSDGKGEFTITPAERDTVGTTVTLHLAKDEKEFLESLRLRTIVKTYSDHVAMPIALRDGEEEETLNTASALWTRAKKDIDPDQYREFYHHVGHAFDDPWLILHNAVEGRLSYTNLLFVPSMPPIDLFDPERKTRIKLYVNRVFITDDCDGLLPGYLRFLRGVVDSEDLPLNISREMFQHDPLLTKIKSGLIKRTLGELKKKAEKKADEYAIFWGNFGAVLKEGIYEDPENRDALLALARFRSSTADGLISLDDYVGRMKPGQEAIYTITGGDAEALARSPQLEGFKANGVEVLLLTDPVDEFWSQAVAQYQDKPFVSATRGDADFSKIETGDDGDAAEKKKKDQEKEKAAAGVDPLIAALKVSLGEAVKDVRVSSRLTDSACCLVADADDMDMNMERMMRQHRQMEGAGPLPRILEINPTHPLIKGLTKQAAEPGDGFDDAAYLLLDQARIMEGEPVPDPAAFARRLTAVMEKGLAG